MSEKTKSRKNNKRKVFFFGYPPFGNLGDHAIAFACFDYIKKFFPKCELIKITIDEGIETFLKGKGYADVIGPNDIITIIGGGNMGNQYMGEEYIRQLVIRNFPNNIIISFPQTIGFVENSVDIINFFNWTTGQKFQVETDLPKDLDKEKFIEYFKSIYSRHKNLYLFAREKKSFEMLKELLPDSKIYLAPDMVLTYKPKIKKQKRSGLGFCLRQDLEATTNAQNRESLKNKLSQKYNLTEFDTTKENGLTEEEAKKEFDELINKFASFEVVITDRLHGLIFAAITGTPCVAIGNYNHKVKGVFDILKNNANVLFCEDLKDAEDLVEKARLMGTYKLNPELNNNFRSIDSIFNGLKKKTLKKEPIKFSICVPVYNVENYLKMCLDSIINQTYKNIEIICVEDCSTDSSPKILEEYAKKDNRIIVLKHDGNKGLLAGRKTAVEKATGDYVMFVDSDDSIVPNACEILADAIKKYGSSMVAFDCNIVNFGKNNEREYNDALYYFVPHLNDGQKLYKEDISIESLQNNNLQYNVWNKIYKTDICKKAYPLLPDERIVWAEDLFAMQYLYYFGNDMVYIDKKLYNYSFGTGVSTTDFDHEKNVNNHLKNIEYIITFLNYLKETKCYYRSFFFASEKKCADIIKNTILYEIMNFIPEEKRAFYIDKLLSVVGEELLIEAIFKSFHQNIEKIAPVLQKTGLFKEKTRKVKNIGIFYHRIGNGGVERVIQKITPLLLEAGYSVTLFVEEKTTYDYAIDERAEIVVLPKFEDCCNGFYTKYRIEAWKDYIEKYNIDTMMYQASSYQYMFYDILILNTLNVNFIATAHELFCQAMCWGSDLLPKRLATIKCVDFMQTLSKTEETFWTNLGVNAKYIINPLTFNPKENKVAKKDNNLVLWVGRLEYFQKKPKDAIDIFKMVYAKNKDARMVMLGKGENEGQTNDVLNHISSCGLDGIVKNIYDNDIKKYYESASVLLMTSTYESAPMVLGEAMSCGLPVVCYDMPYVEMLQENDGVVCVAQRDMASAAQQVLSILQDKEKRDKMGKASKKFIDKFSNQNPIKLWTEVFKDLENGKKKENKDKNYNKIIEEIIYEHYTIGIKELESRCVPPVYIPLSFFARAERCLKTNGIFGTFKKVVKKTLGKIKKIFCKNKNTSN